MKLIHAMAMPEPAEAGGGGGGCWGRPVIWGGHCLPPPSGAEPQRRVASSELAIFLFAHKWQAAVSQGGTGARAG